MDMKPKDQAREPRDILKIDCKVDLKGLISNISLSSTNHVSNHYNENQASQSSANNDWD